MLTRPNRGLRVASESLTAWRVGRVWCGVIAIAVSAALTCAEAVLADLRPPAALWFWFSISGVVGALATVVAVAAAAIAGRSAGTRPLAIAVGLVVAAHAAGATLSLGQVAFEHAGASGGVRHAAAAAIGLLLGALAWRGWRRVMAVPRRRERVVLAGIGLVLVALAALQPSPWQSVETPPAAAAPHDGHANLVVISVDTLRADVLGCYGDPGGLSPSIDAFAASAVVFERCIATAPWTRPSFASVFTGMLPSQHLAVAKAIRVPNGGGLESYNWALDANLAWLPAELQRAGYRTAMFQGNPNVGRGSGLERGFGLVVSAQELRPQPPCVYRLLRRIGLTCGRLENPEVRWDDERLGRACQAWLRGAAGAGTPFFTWINLTEVHAPHVDPLLPRRAIDRMRVSSEFGSAEVRAGARATMRRAYQGEVRFADALVGRLLASIDALDLASNTVVVVLSDHGEELFDRPEGWLDPLWPVRRYWGHGASLRHEVIHVPLLVRVPGIGPARIADLTSLADLAPTLAAFAGLPTAAFESAALPLPLAGGGSETPRTVISESTFTGLERRAATHGGLEVEWSGPPIGFDVAAPTEVAWVSGAGDPAATKLLTELLDHVAQADHKLAEAVESHADFTVPLATRRELEALGYFQPR